jgi:ABC-type multidrug transport system ATPase subunit
VAARITEVNINSSLTLFLFISGAGKTTLMDVIAMRKTSGTISGKILVNGFPQDKETFRRVTGYVEQFDVQAPELTVRETVLYSARLRLDSNEPVVATDEAKDHYVDVVLKTLELTSIADCLVGSDEEGGLSFEQRKRLSIAVELAASPSIIFLDEPTSGLDARAASIVVRSLRRIADTGRTVIATIHQPSLSVFEMFDELLLLKKGGQVVFNGELGDQCCNLIEYFESTGADPIEVGENPANWMLKVITAENSTADYVDVFLKSENYTDVMSRISATVEASTPADKIKFESIYATSWYTRQHLTNKRFALIYYRSPAYNLSRIIISVVIAFILGSVFLSNRFPDTFSETEISSIFATIFISFILMGVLAINSVLPVMLKLRDSFYRHRGAGMVDSGSVTLALGYAEKWFILFTSLLFCLIFIGTAGLHFTKFKRLVSFWGFFTFNLALYSYFGQAFMCLVRGMGTAQILASVFIGLNNFFSGFIVRPQFLTGVFQFTYWITPGHYVYEGMIVSLFTDDDRTVLANDNSEFYDYLGCVPDSEEVCRGTVEQFMDSFFGGKFQYDNRNIDLIVLTAYLIAARLATLFALWYFNYTST